MSNPLTIEEFRRFSSTFEEILKRNLNDRFDHYEKRAISRESDAHRDIMGGFGEVISTVNDHMDERFKDVDKQFKNVDVQFKEVKRKMDEGFTAIERRLDSLAAQQELRKEFDALVSFVANKYNLPATEIIGQSLK